MNMFLSLSPPQIIVVLVALVLGSIIVIGILKRVLRCVVGLVAFAIIVAIALIILQGGMLLL